MSASRNRSSLAVLDLAGTPRHVLSTLAVGLIVVFALPAVAAPPSPPGMPSGNVEGNLVTLTWGAASDDESVTGYNVYRNDRYLTTINSGRRYVAELGEEATTSFYVTAFDSPTDGSARGYSNRSPKYTATRDEAAPDPGGQEPEPDDNSNTPDPDNEPDSELDNEPEAPEPDDDEPGMPDPDVEIGQYNATLTEALSVSINGPSSTDRNRNASAPSAPTGLVALLTADNWVELAWVPSIDDGQVVAYEIYRDQQLVATIDDQANPPNTTPRVEELRSLRTTTYIDCNYTKDLNCQTVGQPQPGTRHTYQVVAVDDDGIKSGFSDPLTVAMNLIEGSAAPDPASEGYTLAFGDDFDESSLDWRNWLLKMPWGPDVTVNGETQHFVDAFANSAIALPYNPFKLTSDPEAEDGRALKITAIPTPPELLSRVNGKPYLSGVLTTRSKPSGGKRYGYVEIRAKVPNQRGLLSTFYLFQADGNQYEIDILEHVGGAAGVTTQNYHYRDGFRYADTEYKGVPHASPTMRLETDLDAGARYHTYSVLWEPELVIWYIDGIEVRRLSGPRVSDKPMDIVAQLVVGSNWIGAPEGVDFPVSYDIDYIRHWQR